MSKTMSKEELDIMQEKLTKALSDKAFAEKVLAMETPEEVRAALLEKDIDLDVDDLIEIKDLLVRHFEGGEELSEDDLEDVSGGLCSLCLALGIIGAVVSVVGTGITIGHSHRW
ncbi:MAG: class IIb bacteriocin, lactobin A/cerein 7B family [Clostridiales bacterium]|nr:class IIb bacteriocin, lactobin A/cerein 7B family [Clostridiales bacterium]